MLIIGKCRRVLIQQSLECYHLSLLYIIHTISKGLVYIMIDSMTRCKCQQSTIIVVLHIICLCIIPSYMLTYCYYLYSQLFFAHTECEMTVSYNDWPVCALLQENSNSTYYIIFMSRNIFCICTVMQRTNLTNYSVLMFKVSSNCQIMCCPDSDYGTADMIL